MPPPTPTSLNPPPPPLDPPFRGYIESTLDSLLVFEAARRGMIPRVTRRLIERERGMVQSGAVFVFDEHESGIKRWTDGLIWSPSRILGNFLVYRETDKRNPANSQPPTTTSASPPHNRSPSTSSYEYDAQIQMQVQIQRPQLSAASISGLDQAQALARRDSIAATGSEGSFKGAGGGGAQQGGAGLDKGKERQLVGSLTNSYRFKEGGLVKKTMSVNVNGFAQHMVSYYSVSDVLAGRLRTPSTIPELMALEISPEYLQRQNFRFPPVIDVGEDGIPRYGGEPADEPGSPNGSGSNSTAYPPQYSAQDVNYGNKAPNSEFSQSSIRVNQQMGTYRQVVTPTEVVHPLISPELSTYSTSQGSQGYFDLQPPTQYQQHGFPGYVNQDIKPSSQELQTSLQSSWNRPSTSGSSRPVPPMMMRQASDSSVMQVRNANRYQPYSHSPTSPGFVLSGTGPVGQQKNRRQSDSQGGSAPILQGFGAMNANVQAGSGQGNSVTPTPTSGSFSGQPGQNYLSPTAPIGSFSQHQLKQPQQHQQYSSQQGHVMAGAQDYYAPNSNQPQQPQSSFTYPAANTASGANDQPGSAPITIRPGTYTHPHTAGPVPGYSSGWPGSDSQQRLDNSGRPVTASSVRTHRSFSGPSGQAAQNLANFQSNGEMARSGTLNGGRIIEEGPGSTTPMGPGSGQWSGGGEMQAQQGMSLGAGGDAGSGRLASSGGGGGGGGGGGDGGLGSAFESYGNNEPYRNHNSHFQPQQEMHHTGGYQNQMVGRA